MVALWKTGQPNEITRGAVMMFQHEHHLAVDGIAGPQVWQALLTDTITGKHRSAGYSYVYVHRNLPQLLTLWHNGRTVLTSPGNTGVPAAPTALGTLPVFEHIPVGTMSGTNPDGTHYNDPGIRWISYFHGGEALHAFNRASFGTPQSLGCVELPLAAAAKVWPYTPIGTLVTIENLATAPRTQLSKLMRTDDLLFSAHPRLVGEKSPDRAVDVVAESAGDEVDFVQNDRSGPNRPRS